MPMLRSPLSSHKRGMILAPSDVVAVVGYLLRDDYLVDLAAGSVDGTPSTPGPGSRVLGGNAAVISISGQKLLFSGISGSAAAAYSSLAYPRAAGLAYRWTMPTYVTRGSVSRIGVATAQATSTSIQHGIELRAGGLIAPILSVGLLGFTEYDASSQSRYAVILRSSGAFLLHGLVTADPLEPYNIINLSNQLSGNLFWKARTGSTNCNWSVDNLHVINLGGVYLSDFGGSIHHTVAPTSGLTAVVQSSGWFQFTWTPVAAETLDLCFRRTDDNNKWIVRCIQATDQCQLIKKVAGVETILNDSGPGDVGPFTPGTPITISCMFPPNSADDPTVRVYFDDFPSVFFFDAFNGAATGVQILGFTTGANYAVWPYQLVLPDV